MTPKQARIGVDLFAVAMIASVAFALAALTWRVQGYAGDDPVAAPIAPGSSRATDIVPVLALSPFGTASGIATEASGGALTLRAVFAAVDPARSVVLIAGADGQVVAFGVGESTPGGIVETIEPERVMLRTGNGLRILSFDPEPAVAPPGTASAPTNAPVGPISSPAPAPAGVDAIRRLIPRPSQNLPESRAAPLAPPPQTAPAALPAAPISTVPAGQRGSRE